MANKPVLVSDMGGVLYSFSPALNPVEHEQKFDKVMDKLGLDNNSVEEQLNGELKAIKDGVLKIYPIEEGLSNLTDNSKNYSIVIVSTSLVETSKYILDKFKVGGKVSRYIDMSDFGSKKDPKAWGKIFKKLLSINVIVEDSEKNLEAANQAARKLGYKAISFTQMPKLKQ